MYETKVVVVVVIVVCFYEGTEWVLVGTSLTVPSAPRRVGGDINGNFPPYKKGLDKVKFFQR